MLNLKSLIVIATSSIILVGCSTKTEAPLNDVIANSYRITNEMNQSTVSTLMPMKPTSIQRINNEEIWKYEGNVCDSKTNAKTYHNLIIKFIDGKVKHIGTFSCNLPVQVEK